MKDAVLGAVRARVLAIESGFQLTAFASEESQETLRRQIRALTAVARHDGVSGGSLGDLFNSLTDNMRTLQRAATASSTSDIEQQWRQLQAASVYAEARWRVALVYQPAHVLVLLADEVRILEAMQTVQREYPGVVTPPSENALEARLAHARGLLDRVYRGDPFAFSGSASVGSSNGSRLAASVAHGDGEDLASVVKSAPQTRPDDAAAYATRLLSAYTGLYSTVDPETLASILTGRSMVNRTPAPTWLQDAVVRLAKATYPELNISLRTALNEASGSTGIRVPAAVRAPRVVVP